MVVFDDNVKQLCVRICKELGKDPYVNIATGYGEPFFNWQKYEQMVEDWLVTDAFSKVRNQYWDEQNRTVKPSMTVADSGSMT